MRHSIQLNKFKYTCKFNIHVIESNVSNHIEYNISH